MRKNSVRHDGGFYGGAPDGRPPGEDKSKDKSEKYIPEKSIKVVDEYGNDYGATWPRRAKGLIKSGRAREIGENIICLTRPPNKKELQAMEHINNNFHTEDTQPEEVQATAAGYKAPPPNAMEMDSALKDAAYWSGKLEMLNKADEENQRQYAETYDSDEDEEPDDSDDKESYDDELLQLVQEYAVAKYNRSLTESIQGTRQANLADAAYNAVVSLARIKCGKLGIEIVDFFALAERAFIELVRENPDAKIQKNYSRNPTVFEIPDVGKIVNDALRGAERGAREAGKAAREAARNAAKNARGAVRGMNFHGMNFNNGWSDTGGRIGTGKLSVLLKPVRDMIEAVSHIDDETIRLQQLNELMGFLREIFNDINQGPDDVIGTGKLSVLLEPVREMIEAVGDIGDETIRAQHLTELRGFLRGIYNDIKQSSD